MRFRTALEKSPDGDNRFRWRHGSKVCLYGLNRLDEAHKAGFVVLVEGESDTHILWCNGFPALGLPGATNWNEQRDAPLLADIPTVYVVVEPDHGGKAVMRRLAGSAITTRTRLVRLRGSKIRVLCISPIPWRFTRLFSAR